MTNPFIKRVKKRFDGFLNLVTGYGTSRDHAEQYNWVDDQPFDRHTLDGLYAQHPVAWKLIDPVVNSSIHNWITIDHAQSEKIEDILYEIRAQDNTTKGLKRSRQHGGSAIYMQIDDGRDPSMPIDFEKATKIISLSVIERHHCHPRYLNRALDPDQYYITNNESEDLNALNLSVVHKDRLIIMKGLEVSTDWMMRNNGWGQSIIQRCRKPLIAYSIAHDIVPNILKDFIRDVIKIDGL